MPLSSDTVAAIVLASIVAIILIVVVVLVLVPKSNCCQSLAPSGAPADKTVMLRTPGLSNAMTVTVNGTTLSGESTMVAPGTLSYQIVVPAHMESTGNSRIAHETISQLMSTGQYMSPHDALFAQMYAQLPGAPQKHMVPTEKVHGIINAVTNDIWTLFKIGDSYTFARQRQVCSHCEKGYDHDFRGLLCSPPSCRSDPSKCPNDKMLRATTVDGACPPGSGSGYRTVYIGGVI